MKKWVLLWMLCAGLTAQGQVAFDVDYGALQKRVCRLCDKEQSPERRALVQDLKKAEVRWAVVVDSLRRAAGDGRQKASEGVRVLEQCYPDLIKLQAGMLKSDIMQSAAYKELQAQVEAVRSKGESSPALYQKANEVAEAYLEKVQKLADELPQPESTLRMNEAMRTVIVLREWMEPLFHRPVTHVYELKERVHELDSLPAR